MSKLTIRLEVGQGLKGRKRTYRLATLAIHAKWGDLATFAQTIGVTRSLVSLVITGRGRSLKVETAVAALIGEPVEKLFPPCLRKKAKGKAAA